MTGPLLFLACADPPDPPITPAPADLPRWSTAPHVRWGGLATDERPLAVFVDEPGGPVDRIAHHVDVATFLNDRFHPLFLTPAAAPDLPRGVLFLSPAGCLLAAPLVPEDGAAFIAAANAMMLSPQPQPLLPAPRQWGIDLPADHPLHMQCPSSSAP